jgi:hypothetical protein
MNMMNNEPDPASELLCSRYDLTSTLGAASLFVQGVDCGADARGVLSMSSLLAALPVRNRSP